MAKTRSENQAHKTIWYNAKLDILQEKIDTLSKADSIGIQNSYIVGVLCFAYLAFYGWKVSSILKSQGIDFDKKISGGH
jgi:hypothetical protein